MAFEEFRCDILVSPAAASKGRQPVHDEQMISFETMPGLIGPANEPRHGVRNAPSQFESFSFRKQVMPASGHEFMCGPLSVLYKTIVLSVMPRRPALEERANRLIMVDHDVVVFRLPAAGQTEGFGFGMGAEVHVRGVEPDEERHVAALNWRSRKSSVLAITSSSMVSIRFLPGDRYRQSSGCHPD